QWHGPILQLGRNSGRSGRWERSQHYTANFANNLVRCSYPCRWQSIRTRLVIGSFLGGPGSRKKLRRLPGSIFPFPSSIEVPLMLRLGGFPATLLSLCILSTSACSKRSGSGTDVSGKVSFKGAPVTGGSIQFYPAKGGGSYPGTIKSDGTFSF